LLCGQFRSFVSQPGKASQERGAPFSQNSNRKSWLELQLQKSKARCIARWQGIGVSEQTAISLAEDLSVGTPEFNQEVLSRKLTLLIGEIGVGKSLIGDRLFQTSILRAQSDINSPTPIYLKADQVRVFQSLEKAMQESISELNFPEIGNIYLIIDEVDDLGLSDARNLLKEAREIIQSEPKINILMISKPIIDFSYAQESIAIERLPREKSTELIKRVSENQNFSPDNLPEPIKEAILTPLFAVLLGTYLKRGRTSAPRTKLQLLSDLVKSSLKDMEDNLLEIDALLTRFAAACIDKGGVEISESEVGSWADQQKLIRSNLITNESGNFRFPLPILTYWFAAQNFLSDNDFISNIVADYRRLERWRYPLVIASSTFSPAQVNKILTPIAEQQPSIAADIVAEALSLSNRLPHFPNQTASGVGCNIRIAMQAWVKGFSPYSQLIPFVLKDATLPSIGVRFNQNRFAMLEVAWHSINLDAGDVVELPPHPANYKELFELGWSNIREFLPYSDTSWHWKWTLERVVISLLESKSLPVGTGYLSREAAWFAALSITNKNPNSVRPIDLRLIEENLLKINFSRLSETQKYCFLKLREEVKIAKENRKPSFCLSPGIQKFKSSDINHETILEYALDVYFGAFQGYIQLSSLLESCLPKLPILSILPARLNIVISLPNASYASVVWSWYWEPLPPDSENEVNVRMSKKILSNHDPEVQKATDKIKKICPQWMNYFSVRPQKVSPCTQYWLGRYPVTKIAYEWLWNDLKQVSWLSRDYSSSNDSPDSYWIPLHQSYSSGLG
jgi:hypothetical protein